MFRFDFFSLLFCREHLRNKTCSPCLHNLVKTDANFWENSRADYWKPETQLRVFTRSRILKTLPSFPPGYEDTENIFYFFYKIIFRLSKKKDDKIIRRAYVYFNFFHKTVNSYNLETANHNAHVIFVLYTLWKHTCRPIKTHVFKTSFKSQFSFVCIFTA